MKKRTILMAMLLLTGCGDGVSPPAGNGSGAAASGPIINHATGSNQTAPAEHPGAPPSAVPSGRPAPGSQLLAPTETGYRAIGTEPFWAVTIKGSVATLERPDRAPERFPISRNDDGRAIRYLADGFAMTVTEGPCSDGMSDAVWSDRVSVAFGEGTLKGCGGTRDDPE